MKRLNTEYLYSTVIEVMFNNLYQEPLEQMTAAYDKGVGLIVKVPLDSGWLTGKYDADSTFTGARSRWSKSDSEYGGAIVDKVRGVIGPDASMIDAALQYILSYRETATVIPGMRTSEQVRGNLSAADVPMSEEMKQTLRQFWIEEIEGKDFPW
ncbi:aldo/keto reductase [Alkalibacterium thalassium]|uniref:aldo/keto reductase n=1 Tax=Alkalibacterium thalassium TaxID=426701 RepID=UPI0031840168